MTYIPDKGDIIRLDFDPSSGIEIMKRRPAFVISRKAFNEHTGLAIVAPITSTVRRIRLEVVLPDGLQTIGAILVHQMKSLDFAQRRLEFIERTPKVLIDEVTAIARIIVL